jgi:hypothetical protein
MAQPSNIYLTNSAVGIREDLSNILSNIAPWEAPFQANIGRGKAMQTRHEWQTDDLAAVNTANAAVEGDDAALQASSPTVRVSNITQIMTKTVVLSETLEAVDKAGRKKELAYQLTKRGRELNRDRESILLSNQASSAGGATVARKLGGLPTWLTSNTNRASDGANGGYSSGSALTVAATDSTGSGRTFTETLLKDVLQKAFVSGGDPKILMVGPFNKQQFSNATNFPGIAELRSSVKQSKGTQAAIVGAADVYLGDFGDLSVVPNRFQREREAFVLDPEYASIATLRPLTQKPLADTGDSKKRFMVEELTLVVKNEAAHGVIADLTTT